MYNLAKYSIIDSLRIFKVKIVKTILKGLHKIKPQGSNFWMIGDSLIKDLEGAKNSINAISIQKIHQNSTNENKSITPDASFNHFSELRKLINQLIK